MKRTLKKSMALLLTLVMALTLLPAMSLTAGASEPDDDGILTIDGNTPAYGDGWNWNGRILTLSGVNVSGISLNVDATILLQGANKVENTAGSGISSTGNLTIRGSGTLEVTVSAASENDRAIGIEIADSKRLTIESGYITVNASGASSYGIYSNVKNASISVTGGYMEVSGGTIGINFDASTNDYSYSQTGGVVKASGGTSMQQCGIQVAALTISGGYLEADGYTGIWCTNFKNSGGVAKAVGGNYGIYSRGTSTFTGGVTIASGDDKGISATMVSENTIADEKVWISSYKNGSVSGNGATIDTTNLANPYVVVAKEAYSAQQTELTTLDGTYIKLGGGSGSAFKPSAATAVSGGSYLEGDIGAELGSKLTFERDSTHPTLVCYGTTNGVQSSAAAELDLASNGTLYAFASSGYGVNAKGYFEQYGNAIAVGTEGGLLFEGSAYIDGRYTFGCGTGEGSVGITYKTSLAAYECITAQGKEIGLSFTGGGNPSFSSYHTDVTCIGGTKAFSGIATEPTPPNGKETYGSTAAPGALAKATYDGTDKTYKIDGTDCKVVYWFKDLPTSFDARNGDPVVNEKPNTDPEWGDYTFAGWYTGIDGRGDELGDRDTPEPGTPYYAKWTNDGKTVVTTPLDFTGDAPAYPADSGITWASPTLTLDGAVIDCSNTTDSEFAVKLPDRATITVTGPSIVKAGSSNGISYGIHGAGALTINGGSTLNVTAANTNSSTRAASVGIYMDTRSLSIEETVSVIANAGTVSGDYTSSSIGVYASINILGGSLTASGHYHAIVYDPDYISDGSVIKTNTEPSAGEGAYVANDCLSYKWISISFGPSMSVSAPTETYTYGTANSESLTVTASNFGNPYDAYAPRIEWVTTSNNDVTVEIDATDNKTVKISTTAAANAGKYEFKVVSPKTGGGNYESAKVTLTIGKADYDGTASKTVNVMINKADAQIGSLTADDFFTTALAGAKIKAVETVSATNGILSDTMTLSEGTLSYSSRENLDTAGLTDTYNVTIESANYNDITATLYFTIIDKTTLTISGVVVAGKTYDSNAIVPDSGGLSVKDGEMPLTSGYGTLVYTYYKNTGTDNDPVWDSGSAIAPINAGSYKLVVSVAEDNPYAGSATIPFTIARRAVTVKADNKSMTVGGTVPAFTVAYTGFVGTDNSDNALATKAVATCAADGKTVGTFDIQLTTLAVLNDTIGGNYEITSQTMGTLSVNNEYVAPSKHYKPATSVTSDKVPVVIDGKTYNIGTAKTDGGVTTVTINQPELQKQLDSARDTVVIPVSANANTVVVRLVVKNLDEMTAKEMTLSIQVDGVSYNIRAAAIDTEALMTALGAADPSEASVNVTIKELPKNAVTLESGTLMMAPVSFTVTATYGGRTVEVEVFQKYVQRVIEIPGNVDGSKITTAVVIENGAQRHVPTEVFQKDGRWYARVNSLTNSTYALIHNEVSYKDTDGKWFENVVTEMASRGIINGRGEDSFDGEASVTRAEFAAILVRALGLPRDGDASMFTDVAESAWYYGAVGKAYEYELINGRGSDTFEPDEYITRQEAMAMVHRAAAITELAGSADTLTGFPDADSISDWALEDARWSVGSGLIQGKSNNTASGMIRGQDNITRGECATIILRLLQESGLIDVRVKA